MWINYKAKTWDSRLTMDSCGEGLGGKATPRFSEADCVETKTWTTNIHGHEFDNSVNFAGPSTTWSKYSKRVSSPVRHGLNFCACTVRNYCVPLHDVRLRPFSIHADWNISLFIPSFIFIHHTRLTSCDILLSSLVLWQESGLAASEIPFRAALLCRIAVSWRYSVAHASTCTCACMLTLRTRECLARLLADLHGAKCIARKQPLVLQYTKTDNAKQACSLLNISRTQWAVPCCNNLCAPSHSKFVLFAPASNSKNIRIMYIFKSSILTVPDLSMHVDTCCLGGKLKAHAEPTVLCKSWGSIVRDRLPWAHVDRCICWILAHLCLKAMKPARPAIEQGLVNGWLCKDKKAEMRLQENIESIHTSTKYNIPWVIRQKQFFSNSLTSIQKPIGKRDGKAR